MLTLACNAVARRCRPGAVPAITAAVRVGVVVRWRELQWQRVNRPAVALEPQRTRVHGRTDTVTTIADVTFRLASRLASQQNL